MGICNATDWCSRCCCRGGDGGSRETERRGRRTGRRGAAPVAALLQAEGGGQVHGCRVPPEAGIRALPDRRKGYRWVRRRVSRRVLLCQAQGAAVIFSKQRAWFPPAAIPRRSAAAAGAANISCAEHESGKDGSRLCQALPAQANVLLPGENPAVLSPKSTSSFTSCPLFSHALYLMMHPYIHTYIHTSILSFPCLLLPAVHI